MTGRTHDTAALTALVLTVAVFPISNISLATALVALLANQIGGIAPDIDQPTAPFWRNLPIGRLFGRFAGNLLGGHRFLTHSILGAALLAWGANWLLIFLHPIMPNIDAHYVWWAFVIGLVSHLLMDTGKWIENFVVFPGLIIVNIFLATIYYPEIVNFIQTRVGS